MKANFTETKKGTWAYIQKSVRINGKSTTIQVKKLGLLSDIQKEHGCEDPRQWVLDLARKMTLEEKQGRQSVEIPFCPAKDIEPGQGSLRIGGDMFLIPLYTRLGLADICDKIKKQSRAKYNLDEILQTLVSGRILYPGSKQLTYAKSKSLVNPPEFAAEDMYRALSLLSGHINTIQAQVYKNSKTFMTRRDKIIYYDCTNYFFEIEDNDQDFIDQETGEFISGLRKRGKSKENRPNPIVQMGMFMDMDGIPLAFVVFPGNESEQTTLRPLEQILDRQFGMTDFIVSTDAGLGSESNRRYNMAEGRDYICVQSLPSLTEADRLAATDPRGWRLAYCADDAHRHLLTDKYSDDGIFNLDYLHHCDEKEKGETKDMKSLLTGTTFYKEILVDKYEKYENPEWIQARKLNPDTTPKYATGKRIPHFLKSVRKERLIVTYSYDFAMYLRHKRTERLAIAKKIVDKGLTNPRRSQQSPLNYIETIHSTEDGQTAVKTEMIIKDDVLQQEEKLDGFYAYATSLDDEAMLVLRARSFHHEIEHLFRTTKTHLDARPVYLSRQDRIKSHFLICFLAMVILKMLQKQIIDKYPEAYKDSPLTIDSLIDTLRDIRFDKLPKHYYRPLFEPTLLTAQLQELYGIDINKEIISTPKMKAIYRKMKKI